MKKTNWTKDFRVLQDVINDYGKYNYEKEEENKNVAVFFESRKGTSVLLYGGFRYRRQYTSKNGARYTCSSRNYCPASVIINDRDELKASSKEHNHPKPKPIETISDTDLVDTDDSDEDSAIVITSRKGKEMLLYHSHTYRKQYDNGAKARWVCSNQKNCRACVFTDCDNYIVSAFEQHHHGPPKYYLNPDHVLRALKTRSNDIDIIEMTSKRGRPLLMYKNYTYSKFPYPLKYGWRWYCSKVKNCKAYLLTTDDHKIIAVTGYHGHEPTPINFRYPVNLPKNYIKQI